MQEHQLWQRAVSFAARRHRGQLRKYGRTPYVAHPVRVSFTVRHVFDVDDPVTLAAALLHDVIEDTKTDYDDVAAEFGREVADLVAVLSKDPRLPEPERETQYDANLTNASWRARLIKLADVLDNYTDAQDDAMRTKMIVKSKRAIVCAGDDPKLERAVTEVRRLIGED